MNKYFLTKRDAHTKWTEVVLMRSMASRFTINTLRTCFARYGLLFFGDNATTFTSQEF